MGISDSLSPPTKPFIFQKPKQAHHHPSSSKLHIFGAKRIKLVAKRPILSFTHSRQISEAMAIFIGAAGISFISVAGPSHAAQFPTLTEPSNALSLPTWVVHVSSVVEWATAMALVWQYGEKSGYESWKGLSWGMVLVALQAALTVIGNATMCFAAYRIYISSHQD